MLGQHLSSAGADPALANMQVIMQLVEGREKEREDILFERETEYLYLRQPIHGIGGDPFHLLELTKSAQTG